MLLCIVFTSIMVLGLAGSAFALSSKPGGVSELLDSMVVPDATAVPVSNILMIGSGSSR